MEKLIGKLSRWMNASAGSLPSNEEDVQLAAAALMFHAMRIDDESHPEERSRIQALLKARFQLDDSELTELMDRAAKEDDEAVDLYRFTKLITANMEQPGRQQIVRMLWEVVVADGEIHEFESNLVWRVAELIGVSRQDRIRIRQDVLGTDATS